MVTVKRHLPTLAEQMDVVVPVKGIRMDEIGKGIIDQEVLHRFRLLYKANIRFFPQNRKMGKSFRVWGNDAQETAPYLCIGNKKDIEHGST
jgi:hypothetical protein